MPRITVEWLEGRSKEQRDQLAGEITSTFVKIVNVKPEQVTIVFRENSPAMQYKAGENYQSIR